MTKLPPACPAIGTGSKTELKTSAIEVAVRCWLCGRYPEHLRPHYLKKYPEWMKALIAYVDDTTGDLGLCSECRGWLCDPEEPPWVTAGPNPHRGRFL